MRGVPLSQLHLYAKVQIGSQKMTFGHPMFDEDIAII